MASEGAMDSAWPARIGAIVFVAVAITAAAIEAARQDTPVAPPMVPASPMLAAADPLRQDKRRCQLMGQAAAGDEACLRVWAQSRDRFLGAGIAPARSADQGR
jgi:conjugative transfer region protein TrbK